MSTLNTVTAISRIHSSAQLVLRFVHSKLSRNKIFYLFVIRLAGLKAEVYVFLLLQLFYND